MEGFPQNYLDFFLRLCLFFLVLFCFFFPVFFVMA
jgi:hypothetical protein